jgi:RND family efflux transporter MFP subunit
MKFKRGIVLIVAFFLVILVFILWKAERRPSATKPPAAEESLLTVPPLITMAQPVNRTFTLCLPWLGTVESKAAVELTALVAGRVEAIEVKDQARVEKGSLVATLGGLEIDGERAKLKAEVDSLRSELELARQTVERLKENLKTQLATKDQVAAAEEGKVKLASQLRQARLNLQIFEKKVRISAPVAGTFTKRLVSVGQEVNPGQVIGEIIDTDQVRIVASVFPSQGIDLQGKDATIRLEENQTLTGLVRSVLPQTSSTGAVIIWIEGPEIDKQLRPGQTVEGDLAVEVRPDVLAVPVSAIVYDQEEHSYLFVRKNETHEIRPVRLGLTQNGWVEVLSGLEQDQLVVTQGAYELFYRQFNRQFKVQD